MGTAFDQTVINSTSGTAIESYSDISLINTSGSIFAISSLDEAQKQAAYDSFAETPPKDQPNLQALIGYITKEVLATVRTEIANKCVVVSPLNTTVDNTKNAITINTVNGLMNATFNPLANGFTSGRIYFLSDNFEDMFI